MLHRAAGISALIATALAPAMAGCASGGTVTDPIKEQTPRDTLVPTPGSTISALIVKGSDTVLHAHLLTPAALTVLSPVPFVRSGDAVDAREAVTTVGRKASVYFVVARVGDLLVAVTYSGWGTPSTATVQQYVESALSVAAGIR